MTQSRKDLIIETKVEVDALVAKRSYINAEIAIRDRKLTEFMGKIRANIRNMVDENHPNARLMSISICFDKMNVRVKFYNHPAINYGITEELLK